MELAGMIAQIKDRRIKDFTVKSLEEYGDGKPSAIAEKVASVFIERLKHKKLIQEHAGQHWVDLMLSAALLHDVFATNRQASIFEARENLSKIADAFDIKEQEQDIIFEAIECQYGEESLYKKCKPSIGTPNDMFESTIWYVKHML